MLRSIDAPSSATADLRLVTVDEVIESLRGAVAAAGSQRAFCLAHDLHETDISNVFNGRRPPNLPMMRAVGVSPALIQRGLPL